MQRDPLNYGWRYDESEGIMLPVWFTVKQFPPSLCRADRRKVPSSAPSDDETSSRKRANQKTDDNLADGEQSTVTNGQKSTAKRRRNRGANRKRREEMNPGQISVLHEVNNNEEIDEFHAGVQLIDISVDNMAYSATGLTNIHMEEKTGGQLFSRQLLYHSSVYHPILYR